MQLRFKKKKKKKKRLAEPTPMVKWSVLVCEPREYLEVHLSCFAVLGLQPFVAVGSVQFRLSTSLPRDLQEILFSPFLNLS